MSTGWKRKRIWATGCQAAFGTLALQDSLGAARKPDYMSAYSAFDSARSTIGLGDAHALSDVASVGG